jgi:hypothetical protein
MTRDQALREAYQLIEAAYEESLAHKAHIQYQYGLEDAMEILNDYRAGLKFQDTINDKTRHR